MKSYWKNIENQMRFMQQLGFKLGFTKQEDWYSLTRKMVEKNGGRGLIAHFHNSPTILIQSLFPNKKWLEWNFHICRNNFWNKKENHIAFLKYIEKKLEITTPEQWCNIDYKEILKIGGRGLLARYNGSWSTAIITCFPEYNLKYWMFSQTPNKFWQNKQNRLDYFNWLIQKLKINNPEDHYSLNVKKFYENCGSGLLTGYYNGSILKVLQDCRPDYKWLAWKLEMCPHKFWSNRKNRKNYLWWLLKHLGYSKLNDLYNVSQLEIWNNYGRGILDLYNCSTVKLITDTFPNYNWKVEKFYTTGKNQKLIYKLMKSIFPKEKIFYNYKHNEIRYKSGIKAELDIYIPNKKIAIEYQGEQHFHPVSIWGGKPTFDKLQERDKIKKAECERIGINLITIDYKFGINIESLKALIT